MKTQSHIDLSSVTGNCDTFHFFSGCTGYRLSHLVSTEGKVPAIKIEEFVRVVKK